MANFYNNEGYASPTEHEAFTRIEHEEKAAAKDRLESINGIFCRADPVSVRMRSFC